MEQGDIFWVDIDEPYGSEPAGRRPFVVVQNNMYNFSRIRTVVACAITTNLKRASAPGNVLLNRGEGNLPRESVVNISQVITLDRQILSERIGTLSPRRIQEIISGLRMLLEPREP
ncbi:MAG: type II toxin-antitoxin system PemK/MazF family toxin [Caldilineaceae bacterium SB0661_bin_32]|uniref:mRNA interferase n=1 Tax=Caldilineaceae bacterium SB0661_bin_32 TaxID=2605255 RepID=A0A6B1D2U0_9CHLR|nr:type II toxin-antitoxin system PemK/MazF family toxin [Caldilineaceae bacterium SB0661_bin_32]